MNTGIISRSVFAIVLIGLGIIGFVRGNIAPGWEPVPASTPAPQVLAYLCNIVYLAGGMGLLVPRTAALAARVLFVSLLLWLVVLRLPWLVIDPQVGTWWPASSTSVILAAAWLIYSSVATDLDRKRFGFFVGENGVRVARALFGIGLIPLGVAHFVYLEATAPLVPSWMQWPVFWSYFTGAAFIAAGLANIFGVLARLAAALITVQIASLTLLVWLPRIADGSMTPFQWNEFFVSILLTTCAWVVADSYCADVLSTSDLQ